MTTIEKKCDKKYFDLILEGRKNFEVRLADFEVKEGDILVLNETINRKPTGRSIKKKVKLVAKTKEMPYWPKEDIDKYGFQIIGFD
jgi:ASC-1-like (ASCH) protein